MKTINSILTGITVLFGLATACFAALSLLRITDNNDLTVLFSGLTILFNGFALLGRTKKQDKKESSQARITAVVSVVAGIFILTLFISEMIRRLISSF